MGANGRMSLRVGNDQPLVVLAPKEMLPITGSGPIPGRAVAATRDAIDQSQESPSPDSGEGRGEGASAASPSYSTRIALDRTMLNVDGKTVNSAPGMAATAEIRTGKREPIEFVLSPLLKMASVAVWLGISIGVTSCGGAANVVARPAEAIAVLAMEKSNGKSSGLRKWVKPAITASYNIVNATNLSDVPVADQAIVIAASAAMKKLLTGVFEGRYEERDIHGDLLVQYIVPSASPQNQAFAAIFESGDDSEKSDPRRYNQECHGYTKVRDSRFGYPSEINEPEALYRIDGATILVDADSGTPTSKVMKCFYLAILGALGLHGEMVTNSPSIFSSNLPADHPTDFDVEIVRVLYRQDLHAGDSLSMVMSTLGLAN